MNSSEYAQQHAEEAKRVTNSWHRGPATAVAEALERKHSEMERAKAEARQRALGSHRNPQGGNI